MRSFSAVSGIFISLLKWKAAVVYRGVLGVEQNDLLSDAYFDLVSGIDLLEERLSIFLFIFSMFCSGDDGLCYFIGTGETGHLVMDY